MAGSERIVAVAAPRNLGGGSLFAAGEAITAANVAAYRADPAAARACCDELIRRGCQVLNYGPVTISFSAGRGQFQKLFGVRLDAPAEAAEEGAPHGLSDADALRLLQPPLSFGGVLDGVAVAHPPQLYESPLPALADDGETYRYLSLPDELAMVVGAAHVHRQGITGRDVVIAMIDTGHYRHPFFAWHGYRVLPTLLGPQQRDPVRDDHGHGTGKSANIFAAAPDARLRPIKGLADPTGDIGVALGSTPRPQVLSNSWGYDVDDRSWTELQAARPGLHNYLRTLEASIAQAVACGMVVCCAAGNGEHAFPGSHPDVISVGGMRLQFPTLEPAPADDASRFTSALYPGRRVPDLCGIAGKQALQGVPEGAGQVAPVQPGAALDRAGAGGRGWGMLSGTSSACPLVAGVAALLLERDRSLSPARIKALLVGSSRGGGGLVDAKRAWLASLQDVVAAYVAAPRGDGLAALPALAGPQ